MEGRLRRAYIWMQITQTWKQVWPAPRAVTLNQSGFFLVVFFKDALWLPGASGTVQRWETQSHPRRSSFVEQAYSRSRRLQAPQPAGQAKVTYILLILSILCVYIFLCDLLWGFLTCSIFPDKWFSILGFCRAFCWSYIGDFCTF